MTNFLSQFPLIYSFSEVYAAGGILKREPKTQDVVLKTTYEYITASYFLQ
jgi:hypothetical protein